MKKNYKWLFVSLAAMMLLLLFWFIFSVSKSRIALSMPLYFFLLIIADLGATAFLSGAMRSTATYEGNIFKGKLNLTGPAVVFFIILILGYKYRPVNEVAPFDLTIYVVKPDKVNDTNFENAELTIYDGNEPKHAAIDRDGRALFVNVNPVYLGSQIEISCKIEGYKISEKKDTSILIPKTPSPVVKLSLIAVNDSVLITGNVYQKKKNTLWPVINAVLFFVEYNKKVQSGDNGSFSVYLPAKLGDQTSLDIYKNDTLKFSSKTYLAKVLKLTIDE